MNFGDHKTALLDDLSVESTDQFYPSAMLGRFVNRAVKWYANLYNWQETQRAVKRDSKANQEYYNYPENFKRDSIEFLHLDGERYKKIRFEEYEEYKEIYPGNTTEKLWADYRNRYFIHPAPSADGVKNIKIWGHEVPDELSNDSDDHPFTDQSLAEEAIHLYALGLALRKARGSFFEKGRALQGEALALAQIAWDNQQADQADYQSQTAEAFRHTDFLQIGGRRTRRGSFNTCND